MCTLLAENRNNLMYLVVGITIAQHDLGVSTAPLLRVSTTSSAESTATYMSKMKLSERP